MLAEPIQPRWSPRTALAATAIWFAACLGLTAGPFQTHVEYFGERLGDAYQWAIIAALVLLVAWAALYVRLRQRGWWRWEPRALAGMALLFLLYAAPAGAAGIALLWAACYATGAAVLDRLGLDVSSSAARLALASTAGLGLLALALIPIGLAGLYGPMLFWVMTAAACLAFWRKLPELLGLFRALDREWGEAEELRSPLAGVLMAFASAFLAAFLAAATAPAIAYDAVSHHLPAARHYLEGGRLAPLPMVEGVFDVARTFSGGHALAYSYYPQSFEELLAFAWALGGQPAAQLVSPLTCLLSMLLTLAIARMCGLSRLASVVGLGAGLTLPFAHWVGAISKNDFPLAVFQLAALYAALRAREGGGARWLASGSALLGLSFGVKHTTLFLAIPIGLLLLWELRRVARPFRLAAAMAAVFAVSGLFWHARTFVLTGNPVFPSGIKRTVDAVPAVGGAMPSRWTIHLTYPWYVHFDGVKTMEGPSASPAGFYFLFFAPLWLLLRSRRSPAERAVLFAVLLFYLYWAYIWGVLRYALAPALLLAMLVAGRAVALADQGDWTRRLTAAGLGYCLAFALLPTLMLEINAPQLAWLAGRLDRDGYLREAMVDYRSIEFVNDAQKPGERVVAINNCSSAYAVDPARFRCMRFVRELSPESLAVVAETLRGAPPDYLVLPVDRAERLLAALGPGVFGPPEYRDEAFQVHRRLE